MVQAGAVGGSWFLGFVLLVWGLLWRVRFPWSFLAFYCASMPLQLENDVFTFKIRTRKE